MLPSDVQLTLVPHSANATLRSSVLIVEDEWIVADEMRRILVSGGYDVCGVARSAEDILRHASECRPSLLLLDLHLPGGGDATEAAARLCDISPVPIVIVSGRADPETISRVVQTIRPAGFVVKPFSSTQLLASVALALHSPSASLRPPRDDVGSDNVAVHDALRKIASVLASVGMNTPASIATESPGVPVLAELDLLSTREREVLDALIVHRRVGWVARSLSISEHTVRNHLKAIFSKLDVHSQDELLALVLNQPSGPPRRRRA